jgi:transcription elongation factor Elf1
MTIKNDLEKNGVRDMHQDSPPQKNSILDFVSPTDFVELPSKGLFYKKGHPLHNKEVIEIKYMTAKEEDILTNESLLRKGLAIERFMESIILDPNIKAHELLIGDRNAILIAARISGYGEKYETKMACPACETQNDIVFDISKPEVFHPNLEGLRTIKKNDRGNYVFKLPVCNFDVECRLLTGKDENELTKQAQAKKKHRLEASNVTDQFKTMIVSIDGVSDRGILNKFIEVMPASDARALRNAYKEIIPNVKLKDTFSCISCNHEQELEVPFGADFFWPDR